MDSHKNWIKDIQAYSQVSSFGYPIISDPNRDYAIQLGMLDPAEKDKAGLPLTARAVCGELLCCQWLVVYLLTGVYCGTR